MLNFLERIKKSSFVLLLFLIPNLSYAQDLFSPEAKDTDFLIHRILAPYFGYGMGYDYADNPFGTFSTIYLGGLMIVAAILAIFTITKGFVDTANAGEILGKKGSLTYLSARGVFGVSLLIPLGSSGLCVIQYAILWLSAQGVLFADVAWESYVTNPYQGNIYQSSTAKKTIAENISKALVAQICIDAETKDTVDSVGRIKKWDIEEFYLGERASQKIYRYGLQSSNSIEHKAICGSIRVDNVNKVNESKQISKDINSGLVFGDENLIQIEDLSKKISDKHAQKMDELLKKDIPEISKSYLNDKKQYGNDSEIVIKNLQTKIQKVVDTYYSDIYNVYTSSRSQINTRLDTSRLKADGIAGAGAYFFKINSGMSKISKAINEAPKITFVKDLTNKDSQEGTFFGLFSSDWEKLQEVDNNKVPIIKNAITDINKLAINISPLSGKDIKMETKEEGDSDWLSTKLMSVFSPSEIDLVLEQGIIKSDQSNNGYKNALESSGSPLAQVQQLGDALIGIAGWSLVAGIGLTVIGGVVSNSVISVVATIFAPFFFVIVSSILIPGVIMAFYIPLKVFFLWVGAIFGWLVLVVEALFGAPMWLVTFLTPDNDSFVGRQGQGYMLILTLTLRPVLMILGFIVAMHLLIPINDLINSFFGYAAQAVKDSTNSSSVIGFGIFTNLLFSITIIILYCALINKMVGQILELIHVIPDNLLQWINGGRGGLAEFSRQMGLEGSAATALGAMNGLNEISRTAGHSVRDIAQHNKTKNQNDKRLLNDALSGGGDFGGDDFDLERQAARDRIKGRNEKIKELLGNSASGADSDETQQTISNLKKDNRLDNAIATRSNSPEARVNNLEELLSGKKGNLSRGTLKEAAKQLQTAYDEANYSEEERKFDGRGRRIERAIGNGASFNKTSSNSVYGNNSGLEYNGVGESSEKEHFSNSNNQTASNIAKFDNLKNNPNIIK